MIRPKTIPAGTDIMVTKDQAGLPSNCAMVNGMKKPSNAPISIEPKIIAIEIIKPIYLKYYSLCNIQIFFVLFTPLNFINFFCLIDWYKRQYAKDIGKERDGYETEKHKSKHYQK